MDSRQCFGAFPRASRPNSAIRHSFGAFGIPAKAPEISQINAAERYQSMIVMLTCMVIAMSVGGPWMEWTVPFASIGSEDFFRGRGLGRRNPRTAERVEGRRSHTKSNCVFIFNF